MTASNPMTGFSQQDRLIRLHTCLGEEVLLAETFQGWEVLDGGGFNFQVSALSSDATLPLASVPGTTALVELLCDNSRTELRPFHGYVRRFERVGSNGGLTRYRMVIEPWLSFLRDRQDSFAFHDMSVIEIAEQIFSFYRDRGVQIDWRWDVDSVFYPKRSLTVQYQESDMRFIARLLAEEGIAYRFEHSGDPQSEKLGRHTLVMSDGNERLLSGEPASIPFHRCDATESVDSVQQWAKSARWLNGTVIRQSRDHRLHSTQVAQAVADAPSVVAAKDRDTSGPYGWIDSEQGARRAGQHLDAAQVLRQQIQGQGTWRRLTAGAALSLSGHAATATSDTWLCLRVEHEARNNLDARLRSLVDAGLGSLEDITAFADRADSQDFLYRNRFVVLPAAQTYRPQGDAGEGRFLNTKPIARGAQTAVVTGDANPVNTDRDHRVKVQLHWQRGGRAASGMAHPSTKENAPAQGKAGTWVRVAGTMAGNNWGSVAVPRVGQEVWVDFLEGAADRPVVVRSLYNGQGNSDAPHSRVAGGPSASTANAACWFPGNEHDDVLHGFRTQDLSSSQEGAGGFRQLMMDHSDNQSSLQLDTTDEHTRLVLGHLKKIEGNQRRSDRGLGAELCTEAHGALRTGAGLLLSTDIARQQMDIANGLVDLEAAHDLVDRLSDVAAQNQASLGQEPAPLPVSDAIEQTHELLSAKAEGDMAGQGIGGGEGSVSAWGAPILQVHGVSGINSNSANHQVWVAGTHSVFTARRDLNFTAQGKSQFVAGSGLTLYTQGDITDGRPVEQTGIRLHASTGEVSFQAQTDTAIFSAKNSVRLISTQANAHLQGKTHLLLSAQGATVKLEGGNIELAAPGRIDLKASVRELEGPRAGQAVSKNLAKADLGACALRDSDASASGKGVQ